MEGLSFFSEEKISSSRRASCLFRGGPSPSFLFPFLSKRKEEGKETHPHVPHKRREKERKEVEEAVLCLFLGYLFSPLLFGRWMSDMSGFLFVVHRQTISLWNKKPRDLSYGYLFLKGKETKRSLAHVFPFRKGKGRRGNGLQADRSSDISSPNHCSHSLFLCGAKRNEEQMVDQPAGINAPALPVGEENSRRHYSQAVDEFSSLSASPQRRESQ